MHMCWGLSLGPRSQRALVRSRCGTEHARIPCSQDPGEVVGRGAYTRPTPDPRGCWRAASPSEGADLPFFPAGLPDPPEDAEVVGRSGHSVTLSWVAPMSDGGGGLCGYRVEMKEGSKGQWRLCHELVPGPECVVDGLTPGETYRFRVAAVGPAGAGEPVHLPQMVSLGEWLPWVLENARLL